MRTLACTAAAAAMLALGVAEAAEAQRNRTVRGSVTADSGRTFDVESRTTRARGFRAREATVTNEAGRSRTLNVEQTRGRDETGAWSTGSRTANFADGTSSSFDRESRWDRESETATNSTERTFRDGTTRTVDSTATRTEPGEWSVARTATGRDGVTREQTGAVSVTQTETGRTVHGDFDTERGPVTYDSTVTRGEGERSRSAVWTGPDGQERTVDQTAMRDPETGAVTRTSDRTFADGTSTSRIITNDRDEESGVRTRTSDFTNREGDTRSTEHVVTPGGDGTFAVDRTVTGFDGETRGQTGEFEVERDYES